MDKKKRDENTVNSDAFPAAKRGRIGHWVSFAIFCIGMGWFFGGKLGDLLYMTHLADIFLYNKSYLIEMLSFPAGGLEYLTSFLIQFFCSPILGAALCVCLCVWITFQTATLLQLRAGKTDENTAENDPITKRFHEVESLFFPIAMIPAAILVVWISHIGYFLFELSIVRFYFGVIPGVCLALGMGTMTRKIPRFWLRTTLDLLLIFGLYPLIGAYAIFGAVLAMLREMTPPYDVTENGLRKINISKKAFIFSIVLRIIFAIGTPLVWYKMGFGDLILFDRVYTIGILEGTVTDLAGIESFTTSRMTWILVFFVVIMVGRMVWNCYRIHVMSRPYQNGKIDVKDDLTLHKSNMERKTATKLKITKLNISEKDRRLLYNYLPVFGTFLILVAANRCMYQDPAFYDTLTMARASIEHRWDQVLTTEQRSQKLSFPMIALRNLALFELDESADYFFTYRQATDLVTDQAERAFLPRIYVDHMLQRYGLPNIADRSAMNQLVCRNPAVGPMRILATDAVVNREYRLARRYLKELHQTLYHRTWANEMLQLIDFEENEISKKGPDFSEKELAKSLPKLGDGNDTNNEHNALLKNEAMDQSEFVSDSPCAAQIALLRNRLIHMDTFSRGMQAEHVLCGRFIDLPFCEQDAVSIQELQLIYRLLNGDIESFISQMEPILLAKKSKVIPRHFQEVLLLFSLDQPELKTRYRFSEAVQQRFQKLCPHLLEYRMNSTPENLERLRVVLRTDYPNTFWRYAYEDRTVPYDPTVH